MINIEDILSNEVDGVLTIPKFEYIFRKFLLENGAYKDFVDEFKKYHKTPFLDTRRIFTSSITNLKEYHLPIYDIIVANHSAFDWRYTERGEQFWRELCMKWREKLGKYRRVRLNEKYN